jgi:hypothetical protein
MDFIHSFPLCAFYRHFSILLSVGSILSSDLFIAGFRLIICQSHLFHSCCLPLPSDPPLDLVTRIQMAGGSAAARMLGLWGRIPPEAWISVVNVVCCQVEVSGMDRSLVRGSPTDYGVSECDL